ncbi:unnamed protein product [Urochloa decumbens]|uniref:Uncharacterized protein n=1 Tax=Urochloa decumbens TaxID=240449 RepID=A0ABC9B2R5_9POAL
MAEAIVGPLVGKLQDLALSEAKALVAVNNDIRTLRDRLMWMQAFLRLADQQRRNSYDELIRVLIKQTRDAAFDAEDAVDLFILKVDLSRDPSWAQSIYRFIAGFTTHVSIRHNLSIKVQDINKRLEEIIQNKDKYVIESVKKNSEMVLWRPSAIMSAVVTTKMDDIQTPIVKRELRDAETGKTNGNLLIDELASKILDAGLMDRSLVINVTGKRGVGKATLVRQVYEWPETQTLYDERVWVSFPPFLSVSNIVHLIYHQQEEDKTWFHGKDVRTDVYKKLEKRKFLLVIDGEVSNTDWRTLLSILPEGNNGSRVVRIMQGSHKPDAVLDGVWIPVTALNQGETTKLFHKWVANQVNNEKGNHGDKGAEMNSEQEDSEDKITQKKMDADIFNVTRGLPLAIVTLCGLLQTKEYPNGWVAVFEHLISRQSNSSKKLDIILTMCFDDLPHDLKSCLLYFAVLPKNTPIESHKLLGMWMAEGFLRPTDGRTMEKMGRIYLKDLVARNLVKVVKKDFFSGEEFVGVHHKIHAFLQGEAQEANFVDIYNCADTPSLTNVRRLSLQNYSDKYAALANPLPKLRSILSSFQEEENVEEEQGEITRSAQRAQSKKEKGNEVAPKCFGCGQDTNNRCKHIRRMFQESRYLRVINLQGVDIGNKLPTSIRNVPHLQYLGVTACPLKFIPKEIGELKDLQTLDVRGTRVEKLPNSFWKIKTLRHVFGSSLIFPKKVGNLKNLQTLETIRPDKKNGWDAKTFEKMVHLQSLYVSDSSETKNVKALCVVIENPKLLEYLEKLVLDVEEIPRVVFTSPSQRRLRAMALCGQLQKRVVNTSGKEEQFCVPNLTFLSLEATKVSQDFIRELGKLPLLANLILDKDSYKDDEQGCDRRLVFKDGEFTRLKKLTLSDLKDLEEVLIGETALPKLTDLVILSCKAIKNIEVKGKCKCVQTTDGVDDANNPCSKFKPVEEIEGNLLEKIKGHYENLSSQLKRVIKIEGEDPNVCRRCKCVDKIKGEDENFCSRCKFVEKIKGEDKKLYGCIRQNFTMQLAKDYR